jgi:hypothetical protein
MSYTQTSAESATHARVLLDAWNCGDMEAVARCLESRPALQDSGVSYVEFERRELLESIMESMREAIHQDEGASRCDVQVSLYLLRHLVTAQ